MTHSSALSELVYTLRRQRTPRRINTDPLLLADHQRTRCFVRNPEKFRGWGEKFTPARDEAGTGDFPSTSPDTCEVRNIADQAEIVVAQQTVGSDLADGAIAHALFRSCPVMSLNIVRKQHSMSLPEQIDELCDAWAEQWQLQSCPDLREFLAATEPALQSAVLPILLPMDFSLRRLKNPRLKSDEYAWLGEEAVAIAEDCAQGSLKSETSDGDGRNQHQEQNLLWEFQSDVGDSFPPDSVDDATLMELKDLPRQVGEFQIIELIGGGGQGVVAKAVHRGTGRAAAIKFIRPELAASLPVRRRFLRESTIARSIRHPNVVQFLSVEEKPQLCIVMEFVTGRTLESLIREQGTLTLQQIVRLGIQMADGLQAVHMANIVHRDLKPMNILLQASASLTAKISDFGVARYASDPAITRSGTIVGSAAWLSPEQALEKKVSEQSDLFSLGSVLYCTACGQSPFQRPTLMATLNAVVEDVEVGVQAIRPDLPERLSGLLRELLQKSPGSRPSSAAEVANRLRSIADEHGIEKTPTQIAVGDSCTSLVQPSPVRRRALLATFAAITCSAALKASRSWWPPVQVDAVKGQASGNVSSGAPKPLTSSDSRVPEVLTLPCTLLEVREGQAAWAKHLAVPEEFEHSAGIRFTLIPPIRLSMTQQQEIKDELLPLQSIIGGHQNVKSPDDGVHAETRPFFAAISPVNWRQYRTLIDGPIANALLARLSAAGQEEASNSPAANSTAQLSWAQTTELLERLGQRFGDMEMLRNNRRLQPEERQYSFGLPQPLEWSLLARAMRCRSSRISTAADFRSQVMLSSHSAVVAGLNPASVTSGGPCLFSRDSCDGTVMGWIDTLIHHPAQYTGLIGHTVPPTEDTMSSRCTWERPSTTAKRTEAAVWPIIRIPAGDHVQ